MDFQIIQSGKATVIARFIEAIVVVFLLSTRLPAAMNLAGDLAGNTLSLLSGYLHNPLAIFVVSNAIILVLVLLSRQNPAGGGSSDGSPPCPAVEERERRVVVVEERGEEAGREGVLDRNFKSGDQKVNDLKLEDQPGVPRHRLRRSETDINKNNKNGDKKVISLSNKTERADLKGEVEGGMPRHQLRRSKTDNKKNKNVGERAISVFNKVDTLSNEEFQRAIDEFIAKQQRFLWAQKMAELE